MTISDDSRYFSGKRIIVIGGVGSVGREIVDKLLDLDVVLVRIVDNNESGLFDMEVAYKSRSDV